MERNYSFQSRNESTPQNANIQYNAPRPVNIGDVFYRIEPADFQCFREPCMVCKDTREVTVNGVTFKCPVCGQQNEVFKLSKYVVRRYRVYGITEEMPHDTWKESDYRSVQFKMYHKEGHGYYGGYNSRTVAPVDLTLFLNTPLEAITEKTPHLDKYIYDDYKLAVAVADGLTERELKKLDEYNELHGSKYTPTFTSVHDKKSK